MSQSKLGSAGEAATSVVIGLLVSLVTNAVVFPMYGFTPTLNQNIQLTIIYTVVSFWRSYWVRRLFNWLAKA